MESSDEHDDKNDLDPKKRPFYKRPILMTVLISVAVVAIIGGVIYLVHVHYHPSTDDAFVDGRIVQVAPRISGKVLSLDVTDNQWVNADTLLIEIDPADYQAKLDQARATLQEDQGKLKQAQATIALAQANAAEAQADVGVAEANATNAQADYQRYTHLAPEARSQQQLDNAAAARKATAAQLAAARKKGAAAEAQVESDRAALEAATGQIASGQAQVEQARLNLSYTHVLSGQAGWVARRTVEQGDYLQLGQPILDVVAADVWITANYKETQLKHMRPGQPASVKVDAYGATLHGHVDSIQRGTGAVFSLLPPENATGNFVHVVERVPVKIVLDQRPEHALALGMSVQASVDVGVSVNEPPQPVQQTDVVGTRGGGADARGAAYAPGKH